MRFYALLITGAFIVFILYFIYSQGGEKEKAKAEVKCQKEKIVIQKEIIYETKQMQKRKVINRSVPTSDNIIWLQNNRCSDCKN